jgi:rhodanese-related sulfurtransferase
MLKKGSLPMKIQALLIATLTLVAIGQGILAADTVASSARGGVAATPALPTAKLELPKETQTTLGLYLTAKEAYDKWNAEPEKVKILDVRTPEEYLFVGHPAMAWNIPVVFQTYQWDANKQKLPTKPNPDFVSQVKEVAQPTEILLVMCRSGGRSALAVNQLAEAGFGNVYNIIDGMEGDVVDDPASVFQGQRMKNGWKNAGLPWTYELAPARMRLPERQ